MSPRFAPLASSLMVLSGCVGSGPSTPMVSREASAHAEILELTTSTVDELSDLGPPLPRTVLVDGASLVVSALGVTPVLEASPEPDDGPRPPSLSCGLASPMPGGFTAGYAADTGLDIAGIKMPVFAIAAGEVEYAEAGHSLWTGPHDTDLAVRIRLDEPIVLGDHRVTHVWYAHLSSVEHEQLADAKQKRHVRSGEKIGTSGVANGAWHLHLGLLLDGDTTQRWGTFLLEDAVRKTLCGLRARQHLAPFTKPDAHSRRVGTALAK